MSISSIYGGSAAGAANVTPSILSTTIDSNGHLIIVYANGARADVGLVVGRQGDIGVTGAKGEKGDKGDTGPQGSTGSTGTKGEKGDPGTRGLQGPAGIRGDQGPAGKGEKGDRGDSGQFKIDEAGSYDEMVGSTEFLEGTVWMVTSWEQANIDMTKDAGGNDIDESRAYICIKLNDELDAGINNWSNPFPFSGQTGFQGDQGIQGEKGDTGPQGIQGEKGETGDQGLMGLQGTSGTDGRGIVDARITDGKLYIQFNDGSLPLDVGFVKGSQGVQGEVGPKGDRGMFLIDQSVDSDPTPTQFITREKGFTVYQSASGMIFQKLNEAGDITSSWSSEFRFRGEKGDQGLMGSIGTKGDAGPEGPRGDRFFIDAQGDALPTGTRFENNYTFYNTATGNIHMFNLQTGKWSSGYAWRGLVGKTGATGPQGEQGPRGFKGDTFSVDAVGSDLAARDAHNGESRDFVFFAQETGKVYFKLIDGHPPGVSVNTLWSDGVRFQGSQGPRGVQGEKGDEGETGAAGHSYTPNMFVTSFNAMDAIWVDEEPGYTVVHAQQDLPASIYIKVSAKGETDIKWTTPTTFGQGLRGNDGMTGPKGDTGASFQIGATINSHVLGHTPGSDDFVLEDHGFVVYDEATGATHTKTTKNGIRPAQWIVTMYRGPAGPRGDALDFDNLTPAEKESIRGLQGEVGPQGPAATFAGDWNMSLPYNRGDMVAYDNSVFQALEDVGPGIVPTQHMSKWAYVYNRVPTLPSDAASNSYALVNEGTNMEWQRIDELIDDEISTVAQFRRFRVETRHMAYDNAGGTGRPDPALPELGHTFTSDEAIKHVIFAWKQREASSDDEIVQHVVITDPNGIVKTLTPTEISRGYYDWNGPWARISGTNEILFTMKLTSSKGTIYTSDHYVFFTSPDDRNYSMQGFLADEVITDVSTFEKLTKNVELGYPVPSSIRVTRDNTDSGDEGDQRYGWIAVMTVVTRAMPELWLYENFPALVKAGTMDYNGTMYQLYRTYRPTGKNDLAVVSISS